MAIPFAAELSDALATRQLANCLRHRQTVMPSLSHDMAGNDYLGLARDRRVCEALASGARLYGAGSGASALVTGQTEAHTRLEHLLADWLGRSAVLLFPSGFQANLAVHDALFSSHDTILADRLNHASLLDGARLSGARLKRYPHLDMKALERRLLQVQSSGRLAVVSDGVFSMDGDCAPAAEMAALCRLHSALLIIDDAHGVGVMGATGGGVIEKAGVASEEEVPVLIGTLSKGLGLQGAFVAGSALLIDTLIQFARPYVYSTSLSPALAHAACTSIELIRQEPERRQRLIDNIACFRQWAHAAGLPLGESTTPIQPLIVGDIATLFALRDAVRTEGFYVGAIRPPTVLAGTARLRITLCAQHRPEQISRLVELLAHQWQRCIDRRPSFQPGTSAC